MSFIKKVSYLRSQKTLYNCPYLSFVKSFLDFKKNLIKKSFDLMMVLTYLIKDNFSPCFIKNNKWN